jgi:hypothetical protein
MFLGYLASITPSFVEVIGVLGGTGYYWQAVWIPVRQKCKVLDDEFMKRVFWRWYDYRGCLYYIHITIPLAI